MSARDVLQKGYADFSAGDVQAASAPWADDFVWEGPNAEGFPGSGRREGKEAALGALGEAVGAWDSFSLTLDELIGDGETVVALAHSEASKGGQSVNQPVVHVWRFDGDTPKRLQILTDTLSSARALGIAS